MSPYFPPNFSNFLYCPEFSFNSPYFTLTLKGAGMIECLGAQKSFKFRIAPLIFLIEALGVFIIRPVTLSVRLAANMTGDHEVMGIAYKTYEFLLPTLTFFLGTFVSFIQSFVFTLLTIVYIALSVEHHDDHH